jgi:hypothetical protein
MANHIDIDNRRKDRAVSSPRFEKLLQGFEPDFEFVPAPRIPEEEFAERIERIRRDATVNGYDATLVHDQWFPALHLRLGA